MEWPIESKTVCVLYPSQYLLLTIGQRKSKYEQVQENTVTKYYLYRTEIWITYISHSTYQTSREASVREGRCCVSLSRQFSDFYEAHALEKESKDLGPNIPCTNWFTFIHSDHLGNYHCDFFCRLLTNKKDIQLKKNDHLNCVQSNWIRKIWKSKIEFD